MMVADAPCPRDYSLRPAVRFLLFQPGVFPRTECPFRPAWLRVTAREGLLLIEDGRGLICLSLGQGRPSRISEIPE